MTVLLLFASFTDPVTRISKVNGLKKEAKTAFEELTHAIERGYIQISDD